MAVTANPRRRSEPRAIAVGGDVRQDGDDGRALRQPACDLRHQLRKGEPVGFLYPGQRAEDLLELRVAAAGRHDDGAQSLAAIAHPGGLG